MQRFFRDTVGVLGAKGPRKSKGYNCDLRKIIFSFKYVWVSWLAIIYEERISAENYILMNWPRSGVFIVKFEQVSNLVLVFLLLTLSR